MYEFGERPHRSDVLLPPFFVSPVENLVDIYVVNFIQFHFAFISEPTFSHQPRSYFFCYFGGFLPFKFSVFPIWKSAHMHKVNMCIKTGGWKLPRSRIGGFWAQLHLLPSCMEKKSRLERSKLQQLYCWMEITWYQTKLSTRFSKQILTSKPRQGCKLNT